jgi:Patatin-like phospholipase
MNGSDGDVPGDGKFFRILSLDGGGIRGVFPAAFLARLEEHLEHPIGRYFDLIAGTSTGGIIAIGLGLGLSAGDILKLYVEQGSAIFDQEHGAVKNWVRAKVRGMAHLFVTKHSSEPLRRALEGVLGRRRLGESRTRLVKSGSGARLHLQDGAPSEARNRLQAAGDRRGDSHGRRADIPQASHDGIRGRTRRRRRVGQQSDRRRRDRGDRHARLARRQAEDPVDRDDQRTRQAAEVERQAADGDRWRGSSWPARRTALSAPRRSSLATSISEKRSGASIRRRRKGDTRWTMPAAFRRCGTARSPKRASSFRSSGGISSARRRTNSCRSMPSEEGSGQWV